MKIAICDDEQVYLDTLQAAVNKWTESEECGNSVLVYN